MWSSSAEVSAKRYRYTGKEKDEESGLYYHGARYYAVWLGRWTAADPLGLVDGLNLYRYSRDNPVNFSDPGGTESEGFNEDQTEYTDKSGVKYSYNENPDDPFNPDPEIVFPDDPLHATPPPRKDAKVTGEGDGSPTGDDGTAQDEEQVDEEAARQAELERLREIDKPLESPVIDPIDLIGLGGLAKVLVKAGAKLFKLGAGILLRKGGKKALEETAEAGAKEGVEAAAKEGVEAGAKEGGEAAAKEAAEGVTHGHHAFPKYLGGPAKQALERLPKQLHEKFHAGLDKILPRQRGKAYYDNLSPEARKQALRDLADYVKAFDAKYGTKLYDAMLKNGFERP